MMMTYTCHFSDRKLPTVLLSSATAILQLDSSNTQSKGSQGQKIVLKKIVYCSEF